MKKKVFSYISKRHEKYQRYIQTYTSKKNLVITYQIAKQCDQMTHNSTQNTIENMTDTNPTKNWRVSGTQKGLENHATNVEIVVLKKLILISLIAVNKYKHLCRFLNHMSSYNFTDLLNPTLLVFITCSSRKWIRKDFNFSVKDEFWFLYFFSF